VKRSVILFGVIFVLGVFADRLVKAVQMNLMVPGESHVAIPYLLRFTYIENSGIGFGLFGVSGAGAWLGLLGTTALFAVTVYVWVTLRPMPTLLAVALGFLCSGAVGNAIDRIVYGVVIDIFDLVFIDFPVFNVADIFVCVGAALVAVWLLREARREARKSEKSA